MFIYFRIDVYRNRNVVIVVFVFFVFFVESDLICCLINVVNCGYFDLEYEVICVGFGFNKWGCVISFFIILRGYFEYILSCGRLSI